MMSSHRLVAALAPPPPSSPPRRESQRQHSAFRLESSVALAVAAVTAAAALSEPVNTLSLPTWAVHGSSVAEWYRLNGDCDVAVEGVEVLERPLYLGIEHYMKTAFDKVWLIFDSAQSRWFRKIVQDIISELEQRGSRVFNQLNRVLRRAS